MTDLHPAGVCDLRADDVAFGEVFCAAVALTDHTMLQSRASDYRQAVEALTMYRLIECVTEACLGIAIVSRVSLNAYCSLRLVKEEAQSVSTALFEWLSHCRSRRSDALIAAD